MASPPALSIIVYDSSSSSISEIMNSIGILLIIQLAYLSFCFISSVFWIVDAIAETIGNDEQSTLSSDGVNGDTIENEGQSTAVSEADDV